MRSRASEGFLASWEDMVVPMMTSALTLMKKYGVCYVGISLVWTEIAKKAF